MDRLREKYAYWNKIIYRIIVIAGIAISITELLISIVLFVTDNIDQTIPVYIRDYVVAPNLVIWGSLLLYRIFVVFIQRKYTELQKK